MKIMGIGTCCLFLLGCTKESFLIQKEDSSTIVLEETIAGEEIAAAEEQAKRALAEAQQGAKSAVNDAEKAAAAALTAARATSICAP